MKLLPGYRQTILSLSARKNYCLLFGWHHFILFWIGEESKQAQMGCIKCYKMKPIAFILMLIPLITGGIPAQSAADRPSSHPNIILIIIDCLRADHLGSFGYKRDTTPYLDRLSKNSLVFKETFSSAPWTKPAVASLFTSLHPNTHTAISSKKSLPLPLTTLAEVLKKNGYATYFFNGGNEFCGDEFNFNQGFDVYIGQKACDSIYSAPELTEIVLEHLPWGEKSKFFAYIHYMDLHLPYCQNRYNTLFAPPESGRFHLDQLQKITTDKIRELTYADKLTAEEKASIVSLYDGQIRYVDENIERIISALRENRLFQNTIFIVTSDHGEEFWDHAGFEHGHNLYNDLLHVPLIISIPGLGPSEIVARARLIDIFPTLMEILGIAPDDLKFQGHSLMPLVRGESESDSPVFAGGTLYYRERYSLIKNNLKIIYNTDDRKDKWDHDPREQSEAWFEVYNLETNPQENPDFQIREPKIVSSLKKELELFISLPPFTEENEITINRELSDKLRSLGYINPSGR